MDYEPGEQRRSVQRIFHPFAAREIRPRAPSGGGLRETGVIA